VLGQLVDGAVEAETGLDRDRQQVERVGQLRPDLVPPLADADADDEARRDEAADREDHGEEEADRGAAEHAAEEQAEEAEADRAGTLRGEEHRRRDGAAHPGGEQAGRDRLQRQARVQPEHDPGQRAGRGHDHALVEAEPLEADDGRAEPAVLRRPADGALALPGRCGDDLAGEVGGAGEHEDGECENHVISP
jgi:hypothetical protein